MNCQHANLIFKIIMLGGKLITRIHVSFTHLGRVVYPKIHLEAPQLRNL
jgi:hypothetical protein